MEKKERHTQGAALAERASYLPEPQTSPRACAWPSPQISSHLQSSLWAHGNLLILTGLQPQHPALAERMSSCEYNGNDLLVTLSADDPRLSELCRDLDSLEVQAHILFLNFHSSFILNFGPFCT